MGDAKPTHDDELTPLELRVLMLLRALKPFERLEIRYDKQGEVKVVHQSTITETFPR